MTEKAMKELAAEIVRQFEVVGGFGDAWQGCSEAEKRALAWGFVVGMEMTMKQLGYELDGWLPLSDAAVA